MAIEIQAAPLEARSRPNPFARLLTEPAMDDALYEPTDEERHTAAEIERKFGEWKQVRQQHEPQWYMNTAFFR